MDARLVRVDGLSTTPSFAEDRSFSKALRRKQGSHSCSRTKHRPTRERDAHFRVDIAAG